MKQKNLILMVVAVGCGLVAAFLTTQINAKPKVEMVEVLVAAKDLPVGTLLAKNDLPKLVKHKQVPKDSLPTEFVVDENDLAEKRLTKEVSADQLFEPKKLSSKGVIILPEGKHMVSLSISPQHAAAGFIGPGSKVDILATLKVGNRLNAFPLMIDMLVLAVDTHTTANSKDGTFANMSSVSFAVSQEQALVLSMAKSRGCQLDLMLRHPNTPPDAKYNIAQVKKILQDESQGGVHATANPSSETVRTDIQTPESGPPVAPNRDPGTPGTAKAEVVKVLKAVADIPENTEITKDLVQLAFSTQEMPKEAADLAQAYGDLTPFFGQVFKTPVKKGQLVVTGMVGPQASKAPPQDRDTEAKGDPKPEKPVVVRRTHDLAMHNVNGTTIYRYEEVAPNEWRLKQVLTPEQAARETKPATPAPDAQPGPTTPDAPEKGVEGKGPDAKARKID
jgi:pilus assembly protein CpaB